MDNNRYNPNRPSKSGSNSKSSRKGPPPPESDVILLLDDDDDDVEEYAQQSYAPQRSRKGRSNPPTARSDESNTIILMDSTDEEDEGPKKKSCPRPEAAKVSPNEASSQHRRGTLHDLWQNSRRHHHHQKDKSSPVPDTNISSANDLPLPRLPSSENRSAKPNNAPTGSDDEDDRKPAARESSPARIKQRAKKTATVPSVRQPHPPAANETGDTQNRKQPPCGHAAGKSEAERKSLRRSGLHAKQGVEHAATTVAVGSKRKQRASQSDTSDGEDDAFAPGTPSSQPEESQCATRNPPRRTQRQVKQAKTATAQKRFPILSDSLIKGARVLARYPMQTDAGDDYFWGEITHVIAPSKSTKFYNVQFDDGDVREKVPSREIMSEQTYYDQYGKLPPGKVELEASDQHEDPPMTPEVLFRERCDSCRMCVLEDCGTCSSCIFNKSSTSTKRHACLLRVCEQIEPSRKAQFVSAFRHLPFRIFFTAEAPASKPCSAHYCFCQKSAELKGIFVGTVLPGCAPQIGCLRQAMISVAYSKEQITTYMPVIWKHFTGYDMSHDIGNHQLVGQGVYYAWTNCHGQTRSSFGRIVGFRKNLETKCLSFQIDFAKPTVPEMADCGAGRRIPASYSADENTAWGGHIAFRERAPQHCGPPLAKTPFHFKWIIPDTRDVVEKDGLVQSIHLTVGCHQLELKARPSNVPDSGRGLFLTCHWAPVTDSDSFVLPAGHLIDLGVYAPHLEEDLKSQAVWAAKNLLFRSASVSWGVEPPPQDRLMKDMFDVSDNVTGDVHPVAARSLIVFANETDGKEEVASIDMQYDPSGAVHYLLGHSDKADGAFELPLGQEVELKVDYGPVYERERVRKGYPRVSGDELQRHTDSLAHEVADFIEGIGTYSVDDIVECIEYLEGVRREHPSPDSLRDHFLLLLLSFGEGICEILRNFEGLNLRDNRLCLNGYDEQFHAATVPRFMELLHWSCFDLWKDDRSFNFSISQRPLLHEKTSVFLAKSETAGWHRPELLQAVADMLQTPYNWRRH